MIYDVKQHLLWVLYAPWAVPPAIRVMRFPPRDVLYMLCRLPCQATIFISSEIFSAPEELTPALEIFPAPYV